MTTSLLTVGAVVVQQAAEPEPGPEELIVFAPLLVRLGWFFVGFLAVVLAGRILAQPVFMRIVRKRNYNNPTLQAASILYFRLVVVVVGTLVGVAVAGYGSFLNDSALVISAVALAVGIAAREVIGSLVSGFALVLDPEFNVGDYIRWEGGEGIVQSIALRVTRVETIDGELVTIPNTILTGHEIFRPYGRGDHRVVQELEVDYAEDIEAVRHHLTELADEIDDILVDPAPAAYVDELDNDGVSIRIHYWITDPTQREIFAVRSAYAQAIKERFDAEGISISSAAGRELTGRVHVINSGSAE